MADWRCLLVVGLAGLLAACSGTEAAPEPEGDTVACAVAGASELADDCTLEVVRAEGATNLIIHHPDGAFRRFIVLPDENGLIAADGADSATVVEQDGAFAVTVGQDRYVVPAAMLRSDAQ
ncbi:MAG: hypothetical protein ABIT10_11435 [Alteraurantiacibacter sp.]